MDRSFSRFWSSPMLTMILSKTGSSEVSDVGTGMPHWNMYWSSPAVFRQTDLPPALGPETRSMRFFGVRVIVTGTIGRPSLARALSRSGWRAFRRFIPPSSDMTGTPALKSSATCAFATRKSVSPTYSAAFSRSGT